MFIVFKKWTAIYIACLIVFSCVFVAILKHGEPLPVSGDIKTRDETAVLIIDPGHGGEDGGAVGVDGTLESHINLAISCKAADIARFLGWTVCMTRCEDVSIHDANAETLRQKKVSDLKNRVSICEKTNRGVLLSFHQNSLPESKKVRGAQVFYNDADGSSELANEVQNELNLFINQEHKKEAKNIGNNSYLMKNVSCPAVLIECGFLSNYEECKLLKSEEYQKKIALVVINAVVGSLQN